MTTTTHTEDTEGMGPAEAGTPNPAFAVVRLRDFAPWQDFLAAVLVDIHAKGGCESVLAALGEIERRHTCFPPACEIRMVVDKEMLKAEGERLKAFDAVQAVLITYTGTDSMGRKVLTLWYGWARPGQGGPALRWGGDKLHEIRKQHGCTVIEAWSSRDESAYARWIEHNLGLLPVAVTLYRRVFTD